MLVPAITSDNIKKWCKFISFHGHLCKWRTGCSMGELYKKKEAEEIGSLVLCEFKVLITVANSPAPQQSPSVNAISCRNCPCYLMKQIAPSFPPYLTSVILSSNRRTLSWVTATQPCVKREAFQRTAHQEVTQLLIVGKNVQCIFFSPHSNTLARKSQEKYV